MYRQALAQAVLRRAQGVGHAVLEGRGRGVGERARRARGRLRRDRGHRLEARLSPMDTFAVVAVIAHRARLRLRQRLPRRGQLDRDRRVDAGPVTAARGRLGGGVQLRRVPRVRHGGRGDDRHRCRRPRRAVDRRGVRRAHRGDRVEPDHVLPRAPDELVARPRRRDRRRRRRQGRLRRAHLVRAAHDRRVHHPVSAARTGARRCCSRSG